MLYLIHHLSKKLKQKKILFLNFKMKSIGIKVAVMKSILLFKKLFKVNFKNFLKKNTKKKKRLSDGF